MAGISKPLTKQQIIEAQKNTKSNKAASRVLHCSYQHYKKYAKIYGLFDSHLNQSGKGIPKFLSSKGKEPALMDLINGKLDPSSFDPNRIKYRLIESGYIKDECKICGFCEKRVADYKSPLILNFKDRNKKNWSLDNLELLCYNHYFLSVGNIFNESELEHMESTLPKYHITEAVDWELDDYNIKRLKELGLYGDEKSTDILDNLISRT